MPLSDKEKQALKEKYKDQRRAMWAGESTLRRSNKTSSEVPSEAQVEDVQFTGEEAETAPHRSEQPSQTETATQARPRARGEQSSRTDKTASRTLLMKEPSSVPNTRTTAGSPRFQPLEDNVPTPDEVQRMKEKIREQREETWEGAASTRSHRRRKQRQTDTDEHQLWDSSENERGPIVLTWKLALGVVGAIIVLIGLGLLLGYWFAS